MKVIILAGGWGTRLGQHTEWIPKPMVQVGSRPLIWHIMKYFAHYGLKEFIVSAGVKAHVIKNYFLNYECYSRDFTRDFSTNQTVFLGMQDNIDWKVSVVDTGLNTLKAARIKRVEHLLEDEVNIVTYGDGLADIDLTELVEFHKSHGKLVTITGVHPPARFGEISEQGGLVTSFHEKPKTSGGLINGGFMVFSRGFLNYCRAEEGSELETDVLPQIVRQNEVMVYKHIGFWDCIDHERDLTHLNDLWNRSEAFWKVWR